MSLSNSTLEPAEAVLRRVERDTYSVADVRKALCYLLAHVEKGDAPPTPWVVAHKILKMPAMYYPVRACVFTLLPHAKHVLARAIHASGPAPTRVLNRSFPTITPALFAQLKAAWGGIVKLPVEVLRSPCTNRRERAARRAASRSSATTRRRLSSPFATSPWKAPLA